MNLQVFVVGKDFGAGVAYYFDLLYPDLVRGIVTLGVPYIRPGTKAIHLDSFPQDFYMRHWQVSLYFPFCVTQY